MVTCRYCSIYFSSGKCPEMIDHDFNVPIFVTRPHLPNCCKSVYLSRSDRTSRHLQQELGHFEMGFGQDIKYLLSIHLHMDGGGVFFRIWTQPALTCVFMPKIHDKRSCQGQLRYEILIPPIIVKARLCCRYHAVSLHFPDVRKRNVTMRLHTEGPDVMYIPAQLDWSAINYQRGHLVRWWGCGKQYLLWPRDQSVKLLSLQSFD